MSSTAIGESTSAPERRSGRWTSGWPLPVIAVALVVGQWLWIKHLDLDSDERRALVTSAVLTSLRQHAWLVLVSTAIVLAIGIPLGVLLSRPGARLVKAPVMLLANAGQAVPSIGILVLLALFWGVGFKMAVIALVIYALLPILRNTIVGLEQVDRSLIDAARGMGMSKWQVLRRVELPLAVPVMLAGARVSLILNVGVATLATYTNAGGLGDLIETGIVLNRVPILMTGCVLTVALALVVDWLAGQAETLLRPRGL